MSFNNSGKKNLITYFKKSERNVMMVGAKSMICVSLVTLTMMNMAATAVLAVEEYSRADFPADFVFGAGSSAYQVEGAAFEDGRTPTIWDTFAHRDSSNGGNGDIACDEYHKYKEDVQLMVEAGLEAYRFSISWSRLIPYGRGPVNPKGLQYYNNLINELIKHGIQPHVTLYHSDTPQALENEYSGWISLRILKDFIVYADICFKEFGDRVKHWTTLNEANIFSIGGYDNGQLPPGRCSPPFGLTCSKGNSTTEPYLAVHHMLLAHSKVFKLYKKKYQAIQQGVVGINIFAPWFMPKTQAKEDVIATQRTIDFIIGWIMHPLTYGDYPHIMKKNAGKKLPVFTASESRLVKGSFDFVGLNHYYLFYINDKPNSLNTESRDVVADLATNFLYNPGVMAGPDSKDPTSAPAVLQAVLEYISQAYENPAIYIQEDGLRLPRNQTLNDTARVKYIHGQIKGALAALRNGLNVKGFFIWSFLDVFELLGGYESGYGLYYVDLDDEQLRRYPKLSARWYFDFLKGGGGSRGINEVIEVEDATYAS